MTGEDWALRGPEYRELLFGCGYKKEKRLIPPDTTSIWRNVTTVDINRACLPHVIANLDQADFRQNARWPLAPNEEVPFFFDSSAWDEVHAYEVLEHLGTQGDYVQFFNFFSIVWQLLKANGYFCATTPSRFSPWLWGDPGHRRAILPETLTFLDQTQYTAQCGRTSMSDYRGVYKADFRVIRSIDDKVTHSFILQAVKPSRIAPEFA